MTTPGPEVRIRPACDCDLRPIVELEGEWLDPSQRFSGAVLEYMRGQRTCRTFVADARGVVGFVIVYKPAGPLGEIMMIDVAPGSRELGVGTSLMKQGEEWLAGSGAQKVYLEVDRDNERAVRLYRDLGYRCVEEFLDEGRWRFLMEKQLA